MTSALHPRPAAAVAPRDPDLVMRLSRMGCAQIFDAQEKAVR